MYDPSTMYITWFWHCDLCGSAFIGHRCSLAEAPNGD